MKRFLLLRDNHENGPYSLEELAAFGLKSSDLIWEEGKSTVWDYPIHFDNLKGCLYPVPVYTSPTDPSLVTSTEEIIKSSSWPTVELPDQEQKLGVPNRDGSFHNFTIEEPEPESPLQEQVKSDTGTKNRRHSSHFFAAYGVWMIVLLVLLASSAWLMKTAVDIFSGKGFTNNKMTFVASPLKALPEDYSPQKAMDADIQNAISREIVPVDTVQMKEPVKKNPNAKELKRYLQVESNDYKVGVFGGINNLQVTVINNSAYILDRVVLQLDYLKPKGESLLTEKYTYFSIPPHGKKTLEIPPTKRGVKVKCKILDAKSREYRMTYVQA